MHPSGRVAISVATDRSLGLWDLTKGKPAYRCKLDSEGMQTLWTQDGSAYIVTHDKEVSVYDGRSGARTRTLHMAGAIDKLCHATLGHHEGVGFVIAGTDAARIAVWNLSSDVDAATMIDTDHAKRVRCVAITQVERGRGGCASLPASNLTAFSKLYKASTTPVKLPSGGPFLVTADSEGVIKLWDLASVLKGGSTPVAPFETLTAAKGLRATALAATWISGEEHGKAPVDDDDAPAPVAASKKEPAVSGSKRKREKGAKPKAGHVATAAADAASSGSEDDEMPPAPARKPAPVAAEPPKKPKKRVAFAAAT